ncbi:hypothetical protein K443DRAFT_168605 [Laccaria amethystina LaAM-08-1]|uniref:Uncharacterized protein n=1 Tax=Laccaria amethystina LaAM-08-1 TaxID=1095629 RepID=A0A0C9YBJ8_9AGAR|nr:hypothetical protein K443DRAFT_168605 [Laccaria amethystina LaAM-08-1]
MGVLTHRIEDVIDVANVLKVSRAGYCEDAHCRMAGQKFELQASKLRSGVTTIKLTKYR